VCAAVVTIATAVGLFAVDNSSAQWLEGLLSWPAMPGFNLANILGLRGGPDGLPHLAYGYVLTFVLWWMVIDLGQAL
jgi:hypothetical protein